jgi:muramoyltetrapeptide carboxypeptidase
MSHALEPVRRLRRGDLVAVAAPSSAVEPERLQAGVANLERLGFRVRVPDGILARTAFTAGDAARRLGELEQLFRDPEVRAVFGARGGGGTIELLPRLADPALFLSDPKPLVGYSDLTFLHLLLQRIGLVTFHGPMVARGLDGAFDEMSLLGALTGEGAPFSVPEGVLRPLQGGEGQGTLLGGCLSILAAAAGTPWALPAIGPTILLLEDLDEAPFRVHRALSQLRLSGAFEELRGVIFGQMPGCCYPEDPGPLELAILRAFEGLSVPIAFGLPSGHTVSPGLTLPLGVPARLACDSNSVRLELLASGVR